jgi:hypothetical protein
MNSAILTPLEFSLGGQGRVISQLDIVYYRSWMYLLSVEVNYLAAPSDQYATTHLYWGPQRLSHSLFKVNELYVRAPMMSTNLSCSSCRSCVVSVGLPDLAGSDKLKRC